jgi:hypothetical protein
MKNALISLSGPGEIDLSTLSNFEAGIAMLSIIDRVYPGITLSQLNDLMNNEGMGNLWTFVKSAAGDIKDGIGDVLHDTKTITGSILGSGVRLAADPKVIDAASRAGAAYATGGGSEAASGALQSLGLSKGSSDQVMQFLNGLGSVFKGDSGPAANQSSVMGLPGGVLPWAIAGSAVLVLIFARKG